MAQGHTSTVAERPMRHHHTVHPPWGTTRAGGGCAGGLREGVSDVSLPYRT
jgi:hypothetical protein